MKKIKIKSYCSIIVSKIVQKLSASILKGGSNFPGTIALKFDKDILKTVASNYSVIIVTGTNGKTTTTSMIYNTIKSSNLPVISNNTGANMFSGIVSCFVKNYSFKNKAKRYAVIEVDEANLIYVTSYITPEIICITNLFRDQLDRYGEVYSTLNVILKGIKNIPSTTLLLNGDESLLGDLDLKNPMLYYGFNTKVYEDSSIDVNADAKFCKKCKSPYQYNFITYNHLGDFYCESCGYKRPHLNYFVNRIDEITSEYSHIEINNQEFIINQPGIYNIYNALSSYGVAKILNISTEYIFSSLKNQKSQFGRQEKINIDGKELNIILVKNPAGYDEAINTVTLNKGNISLAILLNDNYADGRDVSWIWDVNFEKLNQLKIDDIFISGIRLYDMAIRLKISGLNLDKFKIEDNYDSLINDMKKSSSDSIFVLATYTSMTSLRKFLVKKGYIKKIW
ncbi:MAG: MurT ligase domain-containing protein [Clostridiaceae bacterium]